MYSEAAPFYDLIHDARGRDAAFETEIVVGELRRRAPDVRSVLDVACGTGANLAHFAGTFEVMGTDISADMLAIAAERCPGVPLVEADTRTFDLGRTFDAAVCLFSGIGYLTELADLNAAIARMAAHLNSGGVLMIEGWVEPDYWRGSVVNAECARQGEVAVSRVVRSEREGRLTEIWMRYCVAKPDGITTIDESHTMRLSEPAEFADAYSQAGLTFERLPHAVHPGRSLYVGVAPWRGRPEWQRQ
jgi:SAM-dependent methyltransferase